MEKLAEAFGAVFDLLGDHEIDEVAFAAGDDDDLVFLQPATTTTITWSTEVQIEKFKSLSSS